MTHFPVLMQQTGSKSWINGNGYGPCEFQLDYHLIPLALALTYPTLWFLLLAPVDGEPFRMYPSTTTTTGRETALTVRVCFRDQALFCICFGQESLVL